MKILENFQKKFGDFDIEVFKDLDGLMDLIWKWLSYE